MNGPSLVVLLVAMTVVSFTAGWVFRDARARGLSLRKALTWAVLTTQEWPLLLLLYRRIRPRRVRGDQPVLAGGSPTVGGEGR
jgi:hypothetical protein